jgi:hypothetical protein
MARCLQHRLVINNARAFRGQGLDLGDLVQAGTLGLIRAAEKFDWRLGFNLEHCLSGEVEEVLDMGERALVAFRPSGHREDAWPLYHGIR